MKIRVSRHEVLLLATLLSGACGDGEADPSAVPFQPALPGVADAGGQPVSDGGVGLPPSQDGSTATPTLDAALEAGPSPSSDAGTRSDAAPSEGGPVAPGPEGGVSNPPNTTTPACVGKPGARRGKVNAMVMAGGMARTFVYYAPSNLDPNKPAPLVISPHGFTMLGEDMFVLTGYKELADSQGFVAIFPDGGGIAPWNVGEGINGLGVAVSAGHDDQAFIDAMIKYVEDDRCLDKKHIFVSGFSMGGYLSNEVACVRSDIAGVGPHSGGSHDLASCKGTLKPVIIFHGDSDWLIYYENGLETRDRWVKRNGCSAQFDMVSVTQGKCEYYKNCKPGAQVAMCTFNGLTHSWAGGNPHLFGSPGFEPASKLAWDFWRKYAW